MKYLARPFVPRIYRIRINDRITPALAQNIAKGLQSSWPFYPKAILVTINSPGGSILQAKNISDLLRLYSHRLNIPVITFAEDACLGSANIILTTGVKCYAHSFSMIGDLGQVWSNLWFNKLADRYKISQEPLKAAENSIKLDPFKELSQQSQKWVQNYIYSIEHDIKTEIVKNRKDVFVKRTLNKDQVESDILNVGISDPQNYVKLGLLDGLKSFDQVMTESFPNCKVRQVNPYKQSKL